MPASLRLCERSAVGYAIGFARKAVTERNLAERLERARLQFLKPQPTARLFDDVYYAAASWAEPRRLVLKTEWLPKGANPRLGLTHLEVGA